MSSAQRKPEHVGHNVESWLRETVVPALDALKADPSRGRTPRQVRERLQREVAARK